MKTKSLMVLLAAVLLFGGVGVLPINAYSPGEEVPIPFPRSMIPYDSSNVSFTPTGGQVLVSNAPESLYENGQLRPDGSEITGQYNATLYRDTVTGPFRFWASHYNRTGHPLKFWLHIKNPSDRSIDFYKVIESYSDAYVTVAASETTLNFMNAVPAKEKLAVIPAHGSYYFAFSDADHVADLEAMVVFSEYKAEHAEDGSDADVLVSHVVTTSDIEDPTPYATAETIARTNATADRSDDYRGLLEHWGRVGTVDIDLTAEQPFIQMNQADLGYEGEQEKLMTRWDTFGNSVEQREVRFITPTLNKLRLAYWYTDYEVEFRINNHTDYPFVHTLYGSNRSNPGFVNYQLNDGPALNYHFARNTAVPVTTEDSYSLRMLVMPSASLPYSIYFAGGTEDRIPNDITVVKAEHTLIEADRLDAFNFVNTLPDGEEKTELLNRLDAVSLVSTAEAAVNAAEASLDVLAATLQANATTAGEQSVPLPVLEAYDQTSDLASLASIAVSHITGPLQPILDDKVNELGELIVISENTLKSIEQIMDNWQDPIRKGNGKSKYRYKVGADDTVQLNQLMSDSFSLNFPGGQVRYLSLNPDAVVIDESGNAVVTEHGVQPIVVYSHETVIKVYLIVTK